MQYATKLLRVCTRGLFVIKEVDQVEARYSDKLKKRHRLLVPTQQREIFAYIFSQSSTLKIS